jgi:glycosyltransferase involved in cell wall biosynthesis
MGENGANSLSVSVAMTTCNGAAYIREQVESIFRQTLLPDEIIVCDDCSTDGTMELLRVIAGSAPCPMTLIVNDHRLGSTKNFEKAIERCSGDLIALCDQDDVWRPQKLETIERCFANHPDSSLVFSNGDLIDQDGRQLATDMWSRFKFTARLREQLNTPEKAHDLLLSRFFVTGATVAFRSCFRNLCLPFPEHTPTFIHDRWIAVLMSAVGRVAAIDERLISYRLHAQQQMGVGKRPILYQYLTPYNCSSDSAALALVRERVARASCAINPAFLDAVEVRQRHLAARMLLSRNPILRAGGVLKECLTSRYQRYPLGRGYAMKDLLVGTQ